MEYTHATTSHVFACPQCHQPLVVSVGDHADCSQHGSYVCIDGIWRFLGDTSTEFDAHWRTHAASTIPGPKKHSAHRFLQPIIDQTGAGSKIRVLDAGCGNGVHFHVLNEMGCRGTFYGLDVSLEALSQFQALSEDSWTALHADLKSLPLADNVMDISISYGALAYSGDMVQGLRELIRVVRPAGLIGIWFYPYPEGLSGATFKLVRGVTRHMPRLVQARIADLIVPFLNWLPTASGLSLRNASWRDCREVVLVNIAPDVLEIPRFETVRATIEQLDCRILDTPTTPVGTIWMQKVPQ